MRDKIIINIKQLYEKYYKYFNFEEISDILELKLNFT